MSMKTKFSEFSDSFWLRVPFALKQQEFLSFFIVELCLVEYQMLKFCPSLLAAAAVYTAQCTLEGSKHWSRAIELHTNYSEEQLLWALFFLLVLKLQYFLFMCYSRTLCWHLCMALVSIAESALGWWWNSIRRQDMGSLLEYTGNIARLSLGVQQNPNQLFFWWIHDPRTAVKNSMQIF